MKPLGGMIRVFIPQNVRYNKHDVYQIFSTVAQIDRVILHRKKRCADVYLFKRSSMEFVLNQTWYFRGQSLAVCNGFKSLPKCNHINVQAPSSQQRHGLDYSFNEYKLHRSSFWTDVPHHKSKPSRQKIKAGKDDSFSFTTKQNNRKNQTQTLKSSKRGNFGKVKVSTKLVTSGVNNYSSERFLKHSILNEAIINTNQPISAGHESAICATKELSKQYETPVYMMYQDSHKLLHLQSLSYSDILGVIRRHTLIPNSFLLLYHHGKRLHRFSSPDIQPYDSILVLVKGKGGMQNEDNPEYITEKSSEEEVTAWLVKSVGLTQDQVSNYELEDLNGELLFNYSFDDFERFKSLLPKVPIGILRKILILRKPVTKTNGILTLSESKWKCEDVENLVRQTLKGKKDTVEKICKFVIEKDIDGVVFLTYNNVEEIQEDFSSLKEYRMQFEKIMYKQTAILKKVNDTNPALKSSTEQQGTSKPTNEENKPTDTVECISQLQTHRRFLGSGEEVQYLAGKVLPTCESSGNLADRCFEYKYFASSLATGMIDKAVTKFLLETLRFACGVLNSRKNGTIVYGIGDTLIKINDRKLKHGEVVGFSIQETSKDFKDFKSKFTDALDNAKNKCFHDISKVKAVMCIGDPVFIPVVTSTTERVLYVMEVDIEPSSNKCENAYFKLNRSKLDIGNNKKIEKDYTVFIRKGSSTEKIDEDIFIHKHLDLIIEERKAFDEDMRKKIVQPLELPMDKLHRLLCNGLEYFDSSFYPFIVLGKPTIQQKLNPEWIKNLQFIRTIDFYCVFDFDDYSNEDGLCCKYINKNKCEIYNQEIFENFSNPDSFTKLQSILGYPQDPKTVWLFSNGKFDSNPVRPHVDRKTWSTAYLGVREAVSFYSQIIKKQRAMILFLLFSNDFVGIIEILYECIDRFGWDRIMIITTEENVLRDCKKILEREEKCSEEDILRRSIHGEGVTWEHVSSTICKATGQAEDILIRIPMYNGGEGVQMDIHFQDAITDIYILSTTLCKSELQKETYAFNLTHEQQFYKGGKVSWFNFALKHVCTRHIFTKVKENIERFLRYGHENKDQIVHTVTINCQPGAGVSTVGRHLLWDFHERFRCGIITRLTNNTISNIFSLWQYKESSKRNPLILLIDELSEPDLSMLNPQQLVKKLQKHFDSQQFPRDGPICCLIICQRGVEDHENKSTYSSPFIDYSETLRHKLTEDEKKWFDDKFEQIENRKHKYRPDNLISFLILREDFDIMYIKNTITELLNTIERNSKEYELLSFVALISDYANRSYNSKRACIPVECCDEFIGSKYSKNKTWEGWEKSLSDDKRIFLITEENLNYSPKYKFKEIRISHPSIAPAVITVLIERGMSLSELTLKFLDSTVLTKNSIGAQSIIKCKTEEMLKKRLKEEHNDKDNTAYSPLIVRITEEEGWQAARNVLIKGIELFKDCHMYQTLSKLLSNNKQHDDAIHWAKESKKYASSTEEIGFCYQSLSLALKNKFESNMDNYTDINESATEFEDLLQSLQLLIKARDLVEATGDISVLYCTYDIVRIILLCGTFIMERAHFPKNIDRKRLLISNMYDPPDLPEKWKEVRVKFAKKHNHKTGNSLFSMFVTEGRFSFGLIQKMICFEPIYYSHNPQILHRLHRRLIRRDHYPKLLNSFILLFGEDGERPPQDAPQDVLDEWHRGKVLNKMGNNYMDLFNSVYRQYCRREIELHYALSLCMEIQRYLVAIGQKNPDDLINLVAVNFVISFLNSQQTSNIQNKITIKELIGYCDMASKTHDGYVDQAYFFLSLLLWPSVKDDINYDEQLFKRTLNHFAKRKPKYVKRKRDQKEIKGENNLRRASPQFFLCNGKHLNKVCHRFDIYENNVPNDKFDEGNIWQSTLVRRKVKRVEGYIQYNQAKRKYITVTNEISSDEIHIREVRKCSIKSEGVVTFVLGFSIAGPIAYDVQPKEDRDHLHSFYNGKTKKDLIELLHQINRLKETKDYKDLNYDEKKLMREEVLIKEAMEMKDFVDDYDF